jgi:hypothetical protein
MRLFTRIVTVGLLLVTGILGAQGKDSSLVTAMAALDKAYIPALGLTGQGDVAQAQAAFAQLEAAWSTFKAAVKPTLGSDAAWAADQKALDEVVTESHDLVMVKQDNPGAHEALENVRKILLASRDRMGIPYFVDSLTRFHNAMETYLSEKDDAASLKVLQSLAQDVKKAEPLLGAYGLSAAMTQAYSTNWAQMVTLLSSVTTEADKAKVKPLFIKTFFLFGDFPQKK